MGTIGLGIAAKFGLSARDKQTLADTIDNNIAAAFKTGFEHACAGGMEASRKLPQLKNAMPLVLYFLNEKDRQEFADMIHEVKPHMIECKIPEET